ncbi:Latent-transforming growth factor beta-binding protein 2 [Trichinella sp. T8]|nr:Latent-transforming growth factor beta-binding protein 2 [Trichinella sp. T8]
MTSRNEIYFQNKFKNLQNDLKPLNNYLHLSACDSTKSANTPRWKYSLNKYATKETLVNKKPLSPVTNIALVDRKKEQYPRMPVTNFEDEYYSNQISDDYVKLIRYGYKSDAQVQLNANLSDFQGKNVKFPSAENVHVDLLNTPRGSNFYGDNARKKMFSTFPSEKKERKCFKTQLVNPTPINPLLRAKSVNSIDAEIKFANKDDTKKDLFNINNRLLFSDSGRNLNNDGRELSKQYAILQKMYHDWQDVVKGHEEIRVQGKKLNNEAVENFKNFQLAMLHQLNIVQELCNEFLQNEKSDIKNVTKSCSDQSTFENSDSSPPNKVDSLSKISSYKMYRLFLNGRYPSSSDGFYLLYLSFLEIIECDRWQSSSGAKEVLHHKSTSIINFDLSLVVCQSSENDQQLAIFPISGLCNGRAQCFNDAVIKEDQFTFCSNECLPKCGPHGACLKVGQKARCFCDNGYSGKYCTIQEPNECASRPCHFLAQCTNATGIFGCSCLDGFEGDGYNCTDINECELPSKQPLCPENSVCHNIPGSYFCDCATGYKSKNGLGGMCEDIDECEDKTHNCTSLEQCINTDGSFRCESRPCEIGFEKINGVCHDINECKTSNACSPDQSCINLIGSYKCIDQISAGQSKSTSKIDEIDGCLVNESCVKNASVCHDRAVCLSQVDKCACTTGYEGNGIHCIDINECAKDKYICPSETNCINLDGGFTCCDSEKSKEECLKTKHIICKSDNECRSNSKCIDHHCKCQQGFHLNENLECIDIDECSSFSTICPEKNWCVNLPGSYVCCNDTASVSQCLGIIIYAPVQKGSTLNKKISAGSSSQQITVVPLPDVMTTPIPQYHTDMVYITPDTEISSSSLNFEEFNSGDKVTNELTDQNFGSGLGSGSGEISVDLLSSASPNTAEITSELISELNTASTERPDLDYEQTEGATESIQSTDSTSILENKKNIEDENDKSLTTAQVDSSIRMESEETIDGIESEYVRPAVDYFEKKCLLNESYCHYHAKCLKANFSDEFVCACDAGFQGDGYHCEDVDECIYSDKICSPLATCVNTIGSYKCICKPGYAGNGTFCSPLCPRGHKPLTTRCSLEENGQTCTAGYTCIHGFCCPSQSAQEEDCSLDPTICHESASCINKVCQCNTGFEGNGYICKDINECALHLDNCVPPLRCQNTIGISRYCSILRPSCGPNAYCRNNRCACKDGFILDNNACVPDPNNCSSNRMLCDPNATCINGKCTCSAGYIGDGLKCYPDPQDCHNNVSLCHQFARCIDRRCECIPEFSGDGITCFPNPVPFYKNCTINPSVCPTEAQCYYGRCVCKVGSTNLCNKTNLVIINEKNDCRIDPSICHTNAVCRKGICICKKGFIGNGFSCMDDPNDCLKNKGICSPNAICVLRRCKCKAGYVGNGISCVPSNQATTCSSNKDLCDVNAECISDKCVCRAGYLGDGMHCSADKEDCIINPSLCSANAQCISRRCVCQSGFIGNGKTCNESKSDPSSQKNKCENCDFNAVCEDNKCQCKQGFEGNGTLCYNNANIRCDDDAKVCGIHATCISFGTKMVCICNKGYTGNGRDLIKSTTEPNKEKENGSKETSTLQEKREEESENQCDSVKCGPNAECRINMSGLPECRCSRGFTGDGKECYDLNECMLRISKCHHLATCVNTIGSYVCQCPDGYAGDGVRVCSREIKVSNLNYIDTICEKNGITLQMTNRSDLYGKVYVKSQSENPDCSQTLPKKLNNSFKFTARFEKCDFKKEAEDTYSVIMVIQKHPSFITTGDEAYKLVCTYPSAEREVHESLSVETLNSSASYVEKSVGSKCILDVVDANTGKAITEATVGQKLQMKLRTESSGNYELYGTNCVVINMETGESFALTDEDGCAVEEEIFPNWKKMGNSLYSEFITFKWPETATVRFQCDCSVCAHQCPERKCNSKLKSPKKRSTTSTSNAISNQNYVQSNILKIISDGNLESEVKLDEIIDWDNYDNDKICVDGTIMSALFGFGVIFLVAALCALFFKQLANIRNDI